MSFVPELNRKLRNASPNPGLAQQENSVLSITGESSAVNALSSELLLFYIFFRGIGTHGLIDPVEGINASVAVHMAGSNFS